MKKKYMLSSSLMILAAIVLIIVANVFVSVLSGKIPLKLDMTATKIYSISDQTKEYLKNYNTPTEIYILAGEAEQDDNVKIILEKYSELNSNITLKNINMSENPTFGKKYASNGKSLQANSVIIDAGERFRMLTLTDLYGFNSDTGNVTSIDVEAKITSALKYVSSDKILSACIITGHNDTLPNGIKTKLENENYTVSEVNLLTEEIPSETTMAVIFAPVTDFTSSETAKLDQYLSKGGNMQVYFDTNSRELTNLYSYLSGWGIQVSDSLAIENEKTKEISISGSSMSFVTAELCPNELTDSLIENKRTIAYFKYSKVLNQLFKNSGATTVTPLLKTSQSSYASSNYENVAQKDENSDGEKYIGLLSVNTQYGASVYVSGTTMLMSIDPAQIANKFGFANFDFFMNITSFMQGNTDAYTVAPKTLTGNIISMNTLTGIIIGFVYAILIPIAILAVGIVVWARRRHL